METAEVNIKYLIAHINKMINAAIEHGGDPGGPYFSEREKLIRAMRSFLKWCGLENEYVIIDEWEYPRMAKLVTEFTDNIHHSPL